MIIGSAKLTAVQTAVKIEPLASKSLAASVSRPVDWASLNPQPLPPKDVLGNVKASFGALNTKGPDAASLNLFLTVNMGSSLAKPVTSSHQRLNRGADGAVQLKVASHSTDSIVAVLKAIQADQAKATAVDQLTQAEKLAEDAYNTLRNPDSNEVEKLRAQEKWAQASSLRASASQGLSKNQRDALAEVEHTEWQALDDARFAVHESKNGDQSEGWLREYARDFAEADGEMRLGAEENQSLIKWILSK